MESEDLPPIANRPTDLRSRQASRFLV